MINFNNASTILIDGKSAEQIVINGVIVWGQAVWFNPVQIKNNLYIKSAVPQTQIKTNVSLGKFHSDKGGEEV